MYRRNVRGRITMAFGEWLGAVQAGVGYLTYGVMAGYAPDKVAWELLRISLLGFGCALGGWLCFMGGCRR